MSDPNKKPGDGAPAPSPPQVFVSVDEAIIERFLSQTFDLLEAYTANTEATLKLVDRLDKLRAEGLKVTP